MRNYGQMLYQILAQRLLFYLEDMGYDIEHLCMLCGIDKVLLDKNRIILNRDQYERLWISAVELTSNPELAYHFGLSMNVGVLGLLGTLIQHSSTTHEGLLNCSSFIGLLTKEVSYTYKRSAKEFSVTIEPIVHLTDLNRVGVQSTCLMSVAITMVVYAHMTLKNMDLLTASMPSDIKNRELLQPYFKRPITMSEHSYSFTASNKHLDKRILSADVQILQKIKERALFLLSGDVMKWTDQIKSLLMTQYNRDFLTIEAVSAHLKISPRTLQRYLKSEGQTFRAILVEVRKQMAITHLLKTGNVKETSEYIGFMDASSFSKAFKKWTGKTVKEYKSLHSNLKHSKKDRK